MPSQNRLESGRDRSSRYPRISHVNDNVIIAKNSEMDYLKRVRTIINLTGVKSKSDLEIRLSREGLLGQHRQYKQLNILTRELDFERVESGEQIHIREDIAKQTIKVKGKPRTVYRDNKGRFVKYDG